MGRSIGSGGSGGKDWGGMGVVWWGLERRWDKLDLGRVNLGVRRLVVWYMLLSRTRKEY